MPTGGKKLIIAIFVLLLLTGCPGAADYDLDLPGNYSVIRTSAHHVTIALKLGERGPWSENLIPTKVTEVAWDDRYILAKQGKLKPDLNSPNGYLIPDPLNYQFWILDIDTGEVSGPYDEHGFAEKRNELNIAGEIVLREVQEWKAR
ncbi:hypothetical protein XYCOK13_25170 [Xylanibacillus composti]|uniref:DUF3997 domain-containing protein n=1 Tax=Xylanibacillus composti TaxID=1572762 RepID=A0A8J4H712_9BACL|nr:DUF3997 domain-containing protein [Xylanibacillus composti]GIQ69693.1 hypothetical protein XYCOK13_25170 [Xylanibacillus composti]